MPNWSLFIICVESLATSEHIYYPYQREGPPLIWLVFFFSCFPSSSSHLSSTTRNWENFVWFFATGKAKWGVARARWLAWPVFFFTSEYLAGLWGVEVVGRVCIVWMEKATCGGYKVHADWKDGVQDWMQNIEKTKKKNITLRQISEKKKKRLTCEVWKDVEIRNRVDWDRGWVQEWDMRCFFPRHPYIARSLCAKCAEIWRLVWAMTNAKVFAFCPCILVFTGLNQACYMISNSCVRVFDMAYHMWLGNDWIKVETMESKSDWKVTDLIGIGGGK